MTARNDDDWLADTYPKYIQPLRRYLRRFVGSREVAEDLAHDAFMRVWAAPDFDCCRETEGYLYATARNLALDWKKSHAVLRAEPLDVDISDGGQPTERCAIAAEEREMFNEVVGALPERRRSVLLLRIVYGCSFREITDQLKISRATAIREMARAIESIHAGRKFIEAKHRRHNAQVTTIKRKVSEQ